MKLHCYLSASLLSTQNYAAISLAIFKRLFHYSWLVPRTSVDNCYFEPTRCYYKEWKYNYEWLLRTWHIVIIQDFKYYDASSTKGDYKYQVEINFCRLGVVAYSCNPATWRPGVEDDLRSGVLVLSDSRWLGVRTKLGINMGARGEPGVARLAKERRNGPGGKLSSQKSPCWAVVGSRPGVGAKWQPDQQSQTDILFFNSKIVENFYCF